MKITPDEIVHKYWRYPWVFKLNGDPSLTAHQFASRKLTMSQKPIEQTDCLKCGAPTTVAHTSSAGPKPRVQSPPHHLRS